MSPAWLPSANLTTPKPSSLLNFEPSCRVRRSQRSAFAIKCASNPRDESQRGEIELKIGSPIVIIEAPPALKTATPMPCLRANTGQVKAGDVGRVVARKPKDVWAVRLAIETYLLDGKYFRPFTEEE
ncbi:Chlororespiratory reduction 42 [Rhynchospora pubera]|uniref:Chlororespiratory reduction 42 n=1 Tax=Rhynchospora pubera TaxID=906938 RepID=A0AAV8CTG6_9POAL|nr:Chlororespiratory reduction 42 [Rhynchospora pubera]